MTRSPRRYRSVAALLWGFMTVVTLGEARADVPPPEPSGGCTTSSSPTGGTVAGLTLLVLAGGAGFMLARGRKTD